MEQEPAVESFEDQINYPVAFLGAVIGAGIGIIIWSMVVYFFNYRFDIFPILVGVLAAAGTRIPLANRKKNLWFAIIGVIIAALGILIGDFLETAIAINNFGLDFNQYLEIMMQKTDSNTPVIFAYLIGVGIAFFMGFVTIKDEPK